MTDLELALELADRADALTMAAFTGGVLASERKDDGSPVTETDRSVEEALRAALAAQRPSDAVLGEELGRAGNGARCWLLDPIDGTRAFCAGERAWATQIALEVDRRATVGVTSAPALGRRWWGDPSGAWVGRGGDVGPLEVSGVDALADATWSCYPPLASLTEDGRALLQPLAPAAYVDAPPIGAIAVALGRVEVSVHLEGWPWDHAAFAAIVAGAGGRFSYLDGTTELDGVRPMLFTNGSLHDAALALLAG